MTDKQAYAELPERLNRMARCIYIAVEKPVADDISDGLKKSAEAISSLLKENEALRKGFREADRALCHAIQTGFYCGEGVLETLVETRAALNSDAPLSIAKEADNG